MTGMSCLLTAAIDNVLEQEGLALALRQAAELQADQRMKLGVLIDRRRDPLKLAGLVERFDVFTQCVPIGGHKSSRLG